MSTDTTNHRYELIDAGNGKKLEKFGKYTLIRPDILATSIPKLSFPEWLDRADAQFIEDRTNFGFWKIKNPVSLPWFVTFPINDFKVQFRLDLSTSKHIGVFPEHKENWEFLFSQVKKISLLKPVKVLNLFAYTGGASLAAKAGGADVVHVDALKQLINKSKDNMIASGLDGIRWVVEDAFRFVKREVKRGNEYQIIILDPPSFGRGPNGEKWILELALKEIMQDVFLILDKNEGVVILNTYSPKINETNILGYLTPEMKKLFVLNSHLKVQSKLGAEIKLSLCSKISVQPLA